MLESWWRIYDDGFYYESLFDMQEGLRKGSIGSALNLVLFFYQSVDEDTRMLCNLDHLFGEEAGQYFRVTLEHPSANLSDDWIRDFGLKETEYGFVG